MGDSHLNPKRLIIAITLLTLASAGVAGAQTISKVFTPNVIGPGSVSTITFTLTNPTGTQVTGLAFTDDLPTAPGDVDIADPANASTDCRDGVVTAPDGGGTVSFIGGELGAGDTCTVTVDVTASTAGVHTNPAITLTSSAGSSMSLPIDLTVDTTRPGFSKSFAPSSVPRGGKSTLTFTIDNSANGSLAAGLEFTDSLPAGMEIADPASVSNTCIVGTLSATPGTDLISFTGGALLANTTCTLAVDVIATGAGMLENVTGQLAISISNTTFFIGKASDTLEVTVTPLALQKDFTDDPVPPGGTVTLDFRIDNFDRDFPATGVGFTDDLTTALAGLIFSSLVANDCGGSVSGVGTTNVILTGGTIAAQSFCTLTVSLTVPAAVPGVYTNTTGAVTGTVDGSPVTGNTASDDLFVEPVPVLTKEFLEDGTLLPDPVINPGDDVVIRFTITNTSTTSSATNITFIDELTDGSGGVPPDITSGFLPFPVTVVSPVLPVGECGGSIALANIPDDRQGLELTGGNLDPAPGAGSTCTFDVTVTIPAGFPPGLYLNTTEEITATVDGATRTGDPSSDTLTVIAAPSLSKAFTDDPVAPGGTVTLEFTLSHSPDASGDATGITFTDDLAPVLSGLTANLPPSPDPPCGAGSTLTGSAGDTLLTLMGGTLTPGESCTFSVTLDVPAGAAAGTYANTTSGVGATVGGLPTTSAPAEDNLEIQGLVFTKKFLTNPVIPGDTTTLRFTIDNIHPTADATISSFSDSLSAVLPGTPDLAATLPPTVNTCGGSFGASTPTFLQYTGGSVLSQTSCTIEVEVLVPAGAADGTYLNVTSFLSTSMGTIDPATDELTIDSNLLQLTKEFTDDPVAPGESVTLEFTLTNLDAGLAASDIDFTDDFGAVLPGVTFDSENFNDCGATVGGLGTDMITVTGASLGAGGSCTLRVSLTVPGAAAANIYTNTTSAVTGDIGGFAVSGDPASNDLEVVQLLEFSKSFDGPTTATGMATLTFTITNPGPDTATEIFFSDDLDAAVSGLIAISLPAVPCGAGSSITGISFLTFTGGELPPVGGMCSFEVDVLVPASATAGTFPNVTSDLFRAGLRVADPATADLTIEPPPTFAKVFMTNPINAGGTSTLRFTIDNSASTLAASALDFTDNLPAGVVVATPSVTSNGCGGTLTATTGTGTVSLAGGSVGAGTSCTIDVDITSISSGMHVNVTGDLTSSSGNSSTATDVLTVSPAADLSVTKSDGVTSATPGGSLTYTIVASNAGPSDEPTASLTDTFPAALSCTYTSVAAGGATGNTSSSGDLADTLFMPLGSSVTYTADCAIDPDATGTLSNTATITASVTDPAPGNDSATDDDTVLMPETDLSITKTASDDPVVNPTFAYILEVINHGPSDADGVEATDVLPAGVVFDSSADGCTEAAGTVTCDFGTIADGATMTRTFLVALDAPWPTAITNTATVSSDNPDPDSGNNDSTVETALDAVPPEVTEVVTVTGPLAECDTLVVPTTSLSVTIADNLAPGTSAGDPANYLLVGAGPDADFSTVVCAGGAVGDDVPIEIVSLSLTTIDPVTVTAQLGFDGALDPGLYRLLVCDTITDAAGNPLDGDGDTNPGGDFELTFFRADPLNLFVNGHFDECPATIDPWQVAAVAPNAVLPGTPAVDDSDGSPFSTSARVFNSTGEVTSLSQCVPVASSSGLDLRARVRFIPASSEVALFAETCEFFDGASCTGASLGTTSRASLLEDEGGAWLYLTSTVATPAGTMSALCDFAVEAVGSATDFDLYLDGLYFGLTSEIFADGFESGDVSAWSSSTP